MASKGNAISKFYMHIFLSSLQLRVALSLWSSWQHILSAQITNEYLLAQFIQDLGSSSLPTDLHSYPPTSLF